MREKPFFLLLEDVEERMLVRPAMFKDPLPIRQLACFFVRADTSSGVIHATMVPDSKNMDMFHVVAATAKWVGDWGCSQHTGNQPHVLQPVDIRSFDVCEETCTTIR